ncbi:hypothetical protein C8Q74DRAFT_408358 [Fomes fomentarius]|nr:hypothetical protein C8Q74DRAFT_408358 [Fomes fomentarius]
MFTWYADSEVCFAYLEDVPSDCDLAAPDSPFRKARWHTRGWTLQELIAPALVVFVSKEWNILGTKTKFARLLSEITWIYSLVLTNNYPYSNVCVAQRMRWASRRKTTRLEDEAYCLMGLFDVHMPTIYGEGRLAFHRLQEEIMKQHAEDTSLLASSDRYPTTCYVQPSYTVVPPKKLSNILPSYPAMGLFATSPSEFIGNVYYSPLLKDRLQPYPSWPQGRTIQIALNGELIRVIDGATQQYELPRMTRTAYGIECHLPTFEVDGIIVAVLLCEDHGSHSHMGILLHPVMSNRIEHQARELYRVGGGFTAPGRKTFYGRNVSLGNDYYNIRFGGRPDPMKVTWRDICIESRHIPTGSRRSEKLHRLLIQAGDFDSAEAPFRYPRWLFEQFSALGMEISCWRNKTMLVDDKDHHLVSTVLNYETTGLKGEAIQVYLGMCQASSPEAAKRDSPRMPHWAMVIIRHYMPTGRWVPESSSPPTHDCSRDHISDWPNMTKEFGDAERTIRLSFTHSSLVPATLIMHTELDGHAYQRLSQQMGTPLPSFNRVLREGASLRDPQGEDVDQKPRSLRQTKITDFIMTK